MTFRKVVIKYFDLIRTIAAILIGFGISLLCLLFVSKNPGSAISTFMFGPFANTRRFLNMIEFMIPITFTSLGMCMMLQVREFNLIGEGALFLSGAVISLFACKLLPATIPIIIFPLILIIMGAVIGAGIAAVPAFLKIKWNTNEVVVTIMLNYVLVLAGSFILMYWMRDSSITYSGSYKFAQNAKLHNLIPKSQVDTGLILAVAAILFIYWLLYKTTLGFEIRITGSNKSFAQYVGINTVKARMIAQLIGGALAGIAGATEILGKYDRFKWTGPLGYGFDGLMVAVIAKKNPALIPLAAFFLSYIRIGSDIVGATTDVPLQFVEVIQAIVILLVAATLLFDSIRKRAIVKVSTAEMEGQKC